MDHRLCAVYQFRQRGAISKVTLHPFNAFARRLRLSRQHAQRQATYGGGIEQGLANEASATSYGDGHSRTS
jgi:hypothetical protein